MTAKDSPPPADPYSEEARQSRLEATRAEYAKLAKQHAYEERVRKGVGVDWQELTHISK